MGRDRAARDAITALCGVPISLSTSRQSLQLNLPSDPLACYGQLNLWQRYGSRGLGLTAIFGI